MQVSLDQEAQYAFDFIEEGEGDGDEAGGFAEDGGEGIEGGFGLFAEGGVAAVLARLGKGIQVFECLGFGFLENCVTLLYSFNAGISSSCL